MDSIKTALIGCGRIGWLLEEDPLRNKPCTHYGGASSAGLVINYACDINNERLTQFIEKTGIDASHCYQDYNKLLEDIKPDIVIIATWTESHHNICLQAAKNDVRVIILEKPIASNLKQAQQIISVCKKYNVHIIINHERRYDNRYITLKEQLANGLIGTIKTIHASMLTGPYKGKSDVSEGGGPLLHDGTHTIDIIRFLIGEIVQVTGSIERDTRNCGFEDKATGWLKTVNNVDIFLEAGGSREYFIFELIISGSKGKVVIGNGYQKLFLKSKSKYYKGFNDLLETEYPKYQRNNCFTHLYTEVLKILKSKNEQITSNAMDGYKALEVIHALYLSSMKTKAVKVPLKNKNINLRKIFKI